MVIGGGRIKVHKVYTVKRIHYRTAHQKTKVRELATTNSRTILFDFLFQISKELRVEELVNCDTQSVAQLFNGRNGGAVVSATDDIIYSRLCHAAHTAELVE